MNDIPNKCLVSYFEPCESVSLYIHVPFCRAKCAYCGFYSVGRSKFTNEDVKLYFNRLIKEVQELQKYLKKPFETIYIGGGTPLLDSNLPYIKELFDSLDTRNAKEVTIEANAFNIDERSADLVKKYCTRISVGVQSFDKTSLQKMGRFYTSLDECKKILTFFDDLNVNFDFISTPFEDDIAKTSLLPLFEMCESSNVKLPEHLSLYLLTLEEGTPLYKWIDEKSRDDGKEAESLLKAWHFLEKHGFVHYEVSAFARRVNKARRSDFDLKTASKTTDIPIYSSLHNLRYWALENYIGIGATAASHSTKGFDITNSMDFKTYAEGKPFDGYVCEALSKEAIADELLLTHLRTIYGISKEKFDVYSSFSLENTIEKMSQYCEKNHDISSRGYEIKKFYQNGILALPPDELLFSDFYIDLLSVCLAP